MSSKHSNAILIGIVAGLVLAGITLWAGVHFLPESIYRGIIAGGSLLGQLFLLALRMIIVPLIVASVIVGVTSLGDVRRIGGIGGRTVVYYATTTALAVGLGVILVSILQPGAGMGAILGETVNPDDPAIASAMAKDSVTVTDLALSFLHPNIMGAMAQGDMLPVIVFALLFGGVLTTIGPRGKTLLAFFDGLNEVMMKIVGLVMYFAPIGIYGLVVAKFGEATLQEGGIGAMIAGVGKYAATLLLGLGLHALVTLPLICAFFAHRNPLSFLGNMMPAVLTAWSTASSSATLPVTINSAEERAGIDGKAAGFVLPLGATINMDGTALYEGVAVVFIAQAYGVDLSVAQLLIVFITATFASIGAAGIPQAGLVMMVIVLNAVGLPLEGIGLILAIDWLLDRFRTATNVWGDSIGAAYIDRFVK